jgi:hypothetical protein
VIVLTHKAEKLLRLWEATAFRDLNDLLTASLADTMCAGICMAEGCDHITECEKDQDEGHCDACGSTTVTSALVLADII